jgi:hypothetical protein
MFQQAYFIFSVGNIKPIWQEEYPECWKVIIRQTLHGNYHQPISGNPQNFEFAETLRGISENDIKAINLYPGPVIFSTLEAPVLSLSCKRVAHHLDAILMNALPQPFTEN